ncbi:MAG: methyl-accepting chemotaxis protein [Burkholderiaceae bacterium]|nr:methyl-accepting chemotaxis protein [Burkholderiaceae bacterium]
MNFLYNMKIGTRLALGFASACLITIGIAIYGIYMMGQMSDTMARMYKHPMTVAANINAVDSDVVRMHRSMKDVALAQAPEAVDAASAAVDTAEKKMQDHMKIVAERFLGDKKYVEDINRGMAEWKPIRDKVIALSKEGKREEATAITKAEGAAKVKELATAVTTLAELAEKRGVEFMNAAMVAARECQIYFIAAVAVGIVIAALFGFAIARSVTMQIGGEPAQAAALLRRIADGDLTVDVHTRPGDHTSVLAAARDMQASLSKVVATVRSGVDSVSTASSQIAAGNLDLSSRTEHQASNLQQTAASMEEMNAIVRNNADSARQATQLASSASAVAVKGGQVVGQVVTTMDEITASSRKISDIISVIDGIAFQTNILALNAAVEAARAGEQGRGFAVVASEVRNLAQRSADAAKEIKTLIGTSVERVEAGAHLVGEAGSTMSDIVSQVRKVADLIGEISAATVEQTSGIGQVSDAVNQLDQVTQQNAALVEESAAAADSLKQQAERLVEAVSIFKLSQGATAEVIHRVSTTSQATVKTLSKPAVKAKPGAKVVARPSAKPAAKPTASAAPAARDNGPAAPADNGDWESF